MGAALASAAALAACGDDGDSRAPGPPERAADEAVAAMTGAGEQPAEDEPLLRPMPDGLSEEELVRRTGAVPAWQAALDRGRLLARRGERGAALGRVGAEAGGYRWLIDETDRAGGLGIRIAAAAGAGRDGEALPVEEGMRVMAAGAWEVDEERRWVWRVTRMIRLPDGAGGAGAAPGGAAAAELPLPAHMVAEAEAAPEGWRALFVVDGPIKAGDGWAVSESEGGAVAAIILLPGEASPYGGQDFLAADERWSLEVGRRYAFELGRLRRALGSNLPLHRALAPPLALPAAPPPEPGAPPGPASPRATVDGR
ncbi:MAG TPA: hypothetical protein VKZ63_09345 [Kofleriaceae bacterium]|nr:hypothetical protein [Kofleriaceae bacterium]